MSTARSVSSKPIRWERRPEDRPGEILDAALAVFAERGFRSTRLEEVAEAAGVTKGTIYHYFANKEELLLRAIEHYHEQSFGKVEEILRDRGGPVSTQLRLLIRRWFGQIERDRLRIVTLLLQGITHEVPEAHRGWLAGGPMEASRVIASLIERGKERGEFRRDADSEVAARILLSGLLLQTVWQQYADGVSGLAIEQDRLVDSAIEQFLHGLRPLAPVGSSSKGV